MKAPVRLLAMSVLLVASLRGTAAAQEPPAQQLWTELHSANRLSAYAAFCQLRATPDVALMLLKQHLKPIKAVPTARVAQLLKDLDAARFPVRERAQQELKLLGHAAEPLLQQARKQPLSNEARSRIEAVLAHLDTEAQGDFLALGLLAEQSTEPARALLRSLARGEPDASFTREANRLLQMQEDMEKQ